MSRDPVEAPDPIYVRQRWIKPEDVEWVRECDRIMVRHGSVHSANSYAKRSTARNRANKLIKLMVELRLHEKWQLVEHTNRKGDGWTWAVEYVHNEDRGKE